MRFQIMLIVLLSSALVWVAGIRTAVAVAHHERHRLMAYGHIGHLMLRRLL